MVFIVKPFHKTVFFYPAKLTLEESKVLNWHKGIQERM